jgi:glycine/sarcosine N-methyltransferase
MDTPILAPEVFYASVARHMNEIDPGWAEERWRAQVERELNHLPGLLGDARGRSVLDCSCGDGGQAIPLAMLGWRVTATDITEPSLATARRRAAERGLSIAFQPCDMRDLGQRFESAFDVVITCMALDNITDDDGLQRAARGLFESLKPGGRCSIRLRDLEHILAARPRYDFSEERAVPHGRVIRLEDWDYADEERPVCAYVFLREDQRKEGYRWETTIFRYRRRVLRKRDLERMLLAAGFARVEFLPRPSPWAPYEVVASFASDER